MVEKQPCTLIRLDKCLCLSSLHDNQTQVAKVTTTAEDLVKVLFTLSMAILTVTPCSAVTNILATLAIIQRHGKCCLSILVCLSPTNKSKSLRFPSLQ